MNREEIIEKVKVIIADQTVWLDSDEIRLNHNLTDDLNADSMDLVEMVMSYEEEFDIEIPDDDAEKIKTVGDAVEYIAGVL